MTTTIHLTGYTRDEAGAGQGLARAAYPCDGSGAPQSMAGGDQPSFAVLSTDRSWVYVTGEREPGVVRAVPADGAGVVSEVDSGGSHPCHLALGPSGRDLLVSNYGSGSVGLVRADAGALDLVDALRLSGSGPHERQEAPHAHQATFLSDSELVVCDLGSDRLVGVRIEGGRLEQSWEVRMPAGSGPRHLVVSPDGSTLWVVGELDCSLHPVRRSGAGWSVGEPIDVRGPGPWPAGEHTAAGVVVDRTGRHLYVSTRGADLLSHVQVSDDGTPVWRHCVRTAHWPRFVGWLPDGSLGVTAERAGLVQVVRIGSDGEPERPDPALSWPSPTCLAW